MSLTRPFSVGGIVVSGPSDYAIIADEKASGTDGGTFTLGAWRDRDLNTIQFSRGSSISIAADEFTLEKGFKYWVRAELPCYKVNQNRGRIYNVTQTAVQFYGSSETASAASDFARTIIEGIIDLVAAGTNETFKLQHKSQATTVNIGFGLSFSEGGVNEVYSTLIVRRL